jgi:hypothetical protein
MGDPCPFLWLILHYATFGTLLCWDLAVPNCVCCLFRYYLTSDPVPHLSMLLLPLVCPAAPGLPPAAVGFQLPVALAHA